MAKQGFHIDQALILKALMENVGDSIYFKDRHCRLVWASQKMVLDLGYESPEEILGKTDVELFGEEFGEKTMIDDLAVMDNGESIVGLVESRTMPGGELNWTSTNKTAIHDENGVVVGLLGITREINELKRAEQDLQYLATHDLLTSLSNRFLLYANLEQTIKRARRDDALFALLYIDLDDFKAVNDRLGHEAGDQVLKEVAARLTANVRGADLVARMGGDEFVVLLDAVKERQDALMVADKFRQRLTEPIELPNGQAEVSASIGVSLYPDHGRDGAALLRAADRAMYRAKQHSNATELYQTPRMPS